jgi:hypothetical protein
MSRSRYEKFEDALKKATANGWRIEINRGVYISGEVLAQLALNYWRRNNLIFDPYFAKALWGEKETCYEHGKRGHQHDGRYAPAYVVKMHEILDAIISGKDPIDFLSEET